MHSKHRSLRSLLLLGTWLLASCLSAAASAESAIQVEITSGDATPIVLTNPELFGSLYINGWTIMDPAYEPNFGGGLSGGSGVTCTSYPCTADPLEIEISATGFTERVGGFILSACCQDIPAGFTRDLAAFWSASDDLDTTSTPLASFMFAGPLDYGSIAVFGRGHAGPNPYSLTLVDTFTADDTGLSLDSLQGSAGFSLEPIPPVLEPSSIALLAGGLLVIIGTALLRRRSMSPVDNSN